MDDEDRLFQDALRPDQDAHRALLKSKQGQVFSICYRILRHAHDAEDAAQEALIQIIRGISEIREPRAFRHWLCRVAVTTALDHRRRRDRRARHEESRAAMTPEPHDPAVDAVHDALAQLDDPDRCLLVEKYFEGDTIETIARREGLSTAGTGKRIERAKLRLKQRLAQIGLASYCGSVDATLEAAVPIPPTPDLSHAIEAAALSGGAVITSKVILIAGIVLGVGVAGAAAWTLRPDSPEKPPDFSDRRPTPVQEVRLIRSEIPAHAAEPSTARADLAARLARFRSWYEEHRPPTEGATFSMEDPSELLKEVRTELDGVRELILKEPLRFLDWIALPENARTVPDLVMATLCESPAPQEGATLRGGLPPDGVPQSITDYPLALTEGLLRLLQSGGPKLREAVLRFAVTLKDSPREWRDQYIELTGAPADVPDLIIPELAVRALLTTGQASVSEVERLLAKIDTIQDEDRAVLILQTVSQTQKGDRLAPLLTALESGALKDSDGMRTAWVIQWVYWVDVEPEREFEDLAGRLISAKLAHTKDRHHYSELIIAALNLPPRLIRPILSQTATEAPFPRLKQAAAAVLAQADSGEENWRRHRGAWMQALKDQN